MNTQSPKFSLANANYAHAERLIDGLYGTKGTIEHDQYQTIPLAITNDGKGYPIKALALQQSASMAVNPKCFVHVCDSPIRGKYWILVTSHPVETKFVVLILTWLLRNYNVTRDQ